MPRIGVRRTPLRKRRNERARPIRPHEMGWYRVPLGLSRERVEAVEFGRVVGPNAARVVRHFKQSVMVVRD